MTRIILDVPPEKLTSFLHLINQLELSNHSISSQVNSKPAQPTFNFRSLTSKYLLFDWEFFDNELEFE